MAKKSVPTTAVARSSRSTSKSSSRIDFSRLSPRGWDSYRRSLDALKFKRDTPSLSLTRAAREAGTTPPTVRRYAGSALTKRSGRYVAKSADRIPRPLYFYDVKGGITIPTRSSRQATAIGHYHNAIKAYVVHRDDTALRRFEGKSIRVNGVDYLYITDRRILRRFERAGILRFLDIYQEKFNDDGT